MPTAFTVSVSEQFPCTEYCIFRHASSVETLHVTRFLPWGTVPDLKHLLVKIGDAWKVGGEVQNYFQGFSQSLPIVPIFHWIIERFGLEGTFRDLLAQPPLQWAGTPSTGSGCSEPCPTWPGMFPGMGSPLKATHAPHWPMMGNCIFHKAPCALPPTSWRETGASTFLKLLCPPVNLPLL